MSFILPLTDYLITHSTLFFAKSIFSRPLDYKSVWGVRGAGTDISPDTDINRYNTC